MTLWVLEGGYPVVPRGNAIVYTGMTVRTCQRDPKTPRGFVGSNTLQDLKGLKAFGGLQMPVNPKFGGLKPRGGPKAKLKSFCFFIS